MNEEFNPSGDDVPILPNESCDTLDFLSETSGDRGSSIYISEFESDDEGKSISNMNVCIDEGVNGCEYEHGCEYKHGCEYEHGCAYKHGCAYEHGCEYEHGCAYEHGCEYEHGM